MHGNAVYIRAETKLEILTDIHFQCEISILSTQLTSLSIKRTTPVTARNYLLM